MNFQGLQARYRRLFQENAAWKLLRADNAPIILAFISDAFSEESEVSFGHARIALDVELAQCRESGILESETGAGTYLNQWIRAGWLREMDNQLMKTDASEVALRFCQGLDQKSAATTASHLRIVQEAVRDFVVAISPSSDERLMLLEYRKAEIQREIDDLNAGVVTELPEAQQRERIREIYQLASVLTGDFRRLEDEIRELDQVIRVQMIESGQTRGDILSSVMEKEALLANTDAGSAFEGFYQLLCDQNRQTEFRDQLRSILSQPVSKHLSPPQQQFLGKLMRELSRESDRVFSIRRRTEESLRNYIESGAAFENRAVDQLLSQLERLAIALKDASPDFPGELKKSTGLNLPVGTLKITSVDAMRLKVPDETLDTSGVEEKVNSRSPSVEMLDCLDEVQVKEVAYRIRDILYQQGPLTIAAVASWHPLTSGLEELVAYLRVAKSVGATTLEDKEALTILDKQGVRLKVSIPRYLLSADLFPDNIEEMVI
ncbi:MAG TPA: DUF3375 domain-containing protein [Gammaproteobacteria bacterium]|nr:DUF3375 domain-containing protein [Gammaproteobacteria bacterium]